MRIPGRVHVAPLLALMLSVGCGEETTPASDDAIDGSVTGITPDAALPDAALVDAARGDAGDSAVASDGGAASDGSADADASGETDAGNGTAGGRARGELCGGIAGFRCATGLFCDYSSDAGGTGCSGIADASGKCATTPDACDDIYQPVCSCNVHSYGNACEANSAGASVLHTGLCTAEECTAQGGRPAYSNGASTPSCNTGESSFPIPGKEAAICCVPAP